MNRVASAASWSRLFCISLFICVMASPIAGQVNVQFDGEMVAEETSRVSQPSWLLWSGRSTSRDRQDSGSARPVYLSEPWPEEGRLLPPPPVLSHLADPHSRRLPSLRFPSPRQRHPNRWYPRPPPSSGAGPAGGQQWGGADRSALQNSEASDRPRYDAMNGDPRTDAHQKYMNAHKRKPITSPGGFQGDGPLRRPARRQEQYIRTGSADRWEIREPNQSLVTEPARRPSRLPDGISGGDQVSVIRQNQRPASRSPPPVTGSGPPAGRAEARPPAAALRRPRLLFDHHQRATDTYRRHEPIPKSGGPTEANRQYQSSGGQPVQWRRRPAGPPATTPVKRSRPPPLSVEYARLALEAVAAVSLAVTERPTASGVAEPGKDQQSSSAEYGSRMVDEAPVLDDSNQHEGHQSLEEKSVWNDTAAEPVPDIWPSTKISGSVGADQVDTVPAPDESSEHNMFPSVEPESVPHRLDVAAELTALSAVLLRPRDTSTRELNAIPPRTDEQHDKQTAEVTRAALTSEGVIRVPLGRPPGDNTRTAAVSSTNSTDSFSISGVSVNDSGTTFLDIHTTKETKMLAASEVDVEVEASENGPAQETEEAVTQSRGHDTSQYDYVYDDHYYYNTDSDVNIAVETSETPLTSVVPRPPPLLKPLEQGTTQLGVTEHFGPSGFPTVIHLQEDTDENITQGIGRPAVTTLEGMNAETPLDLAAGAPKVLAVAGSVAPEDDKTTFEPGNVRRDDKVEQIIPYITSRPPKTSTQTVKANAKEVKLNLTASQQPLGHSMTLKFPSNADEEVENYASEEYSFSNSSEEDLPATKTSTTETVTLHGKIDRFDGLTASYNDMINNVISEVIQGVFNYVETTVPTRVSTTVTQVENGIQHHNCDTELCDDLMEQPPTSRTTDIAFELMHDKQMSPVTTAKATITDTNKAILEDEASSSVAATEPPNGVTFHETFTPVAGESTESANLALTVGFGSTESQPQYTSKTEQYLSEHNYEINHFTDANKLSKGVTAEASPEFTDTSGHLPKVRGHQHVNTSYAESIAVTTTPSTMVTLNISQSTEQSTEGSVTHTNSPDTSTPRQRTRLYLFSNFPEFAGGERSTPETSTGPHGYQFSLAEMKEVPENQGILLAVKQSPNLELPTTQTERTISVITTPSPSPVVANNFMTTMEPSVASTDSYESRSLFSQATQDTISYQNSIATTSSKPFSHADEKSSEGSSQYEPSVATTESAMASTKSTSTRRPISRLQWRPTFSELFRFSGNMPVTVTQPTIPEFLSTQPVTEITDIGVMPDFYTTQHNTLISSSPPTSTGSSALPSTATSFTTAIPAAEAIVAFTNRSSSKPSLAEVRAAIQPFSLAEMLVESGQNVVSFLRSNYTMAEVLLVIDRLRTRREGLPVTTTDHPHTTAEATERVVVTATAPGDTGRTAARTTVARTSQRDLENGSRAAYGTLNSAQQTPQEFPVGSEEEKQPNPSGRLSVVTTDNPLSTYFTPAVRRRKQWSLAEIFDEKQTSLPEFLAQGGDVKQLLLEYNGVALSSGAGGDSASQTTTTSVPSTTTERTYSLKEILDIRQQTLKQFISGGGEVNAILEKYNDAGRRPPPRTSPVVPNIPSRMSAFLTRSKAMADAPGGTSGASSAAGEVPADLEGLKPLLGEGGRYLVVKTDQQRSSQLGIRLLTPAPPIYGRPAATPPHLQGERPHLAAPPPPGPALKSTLAPILLSNELFERINQETEAVLAAAGGDSGGGSGRDRHYEVDSTVFDIELSPSGSAVSAAVRHAVIASAVIGGCALIFFVALLLFCKWRQRCEQQVLRPSLTVDSECSNCNTDPSRINVNNYAKAYHHKTTSFWGSLRKPFNQRYAAAYSEST